MGSSIVDVTYDDPRTGERVRERKIYEIPAEDVERVRTRELAIFNESRSPDRNREKEQVLVRRASSRDDREVSNYRSSRNERSSYEDRDSRYLQPDRDVRRGQDDNGDDEVYWYRQTIRRGPKSDVYPSDRRVRGGEVVRSGRDRRQRNRSPSSSDSSRDNHRRRRRHRRARSEQGNRDANNDDGGGGGRLWYSMKKREDGNFLERHFDSSYDGLIAGAAGAAIGAMTARKFTGGHHQPHTIGEENQEKTNRNWKTVAGAVIGAAAFNTVENHYRTYTEEDFEEKKDHIKHKLKDATGGLL